MDMAEENVETIDNCTDFPLELVSFGTRQTITTYRCRVHHCPQALAYRDQGYKEVARLVCVPDLAHGAPGCEKRAACGYQRADTRFQTPYPHFKLDIRLLAHPALFFLHKLIFAAHASYCGICKVC